MTRARTLHESARLISAPIAPADDSPRIVIEYGHRLARRPYHVEFALQAETGTLISRYQDPMTPWDLRRDRDAINAPVLEALESLLAAYLETAADEDGRA